MALTDKITTPALVSGLVAFTGVYYNCSGHYPRRRGCAPIIKYLIDDPVPSSAVKNVIEYGINIATIAE